MSLYLRNQNNLDSAIDDIFKEVIISEDGSQKKVIKEKIYYDEYLERMINIALRKRSLVKDKSKNYCAHLEKNEIKK